MTATGELSQHTIAGTVLTMPVRVRKAQQRMAMFAVDADAAQQMIDYSGLRVFRLRPDRAVVVLMLMRYLDSDLGQYYEFGTNVMVNPPGEDHAGPRAMQSAGAFIHHLPVDQEFTLEAGRTIWGYPKVLADFTIRDGRQFGFDVSNEGRLIAGMEFRPGLPIPGRFTSAQQEYRTYSHTGGVTRQTIGESRLTGVRYRPGGARIWLGDHPYARELAALGLPKRPFMSGSADNVDMTFADAQEIA